MIKRRAENTKGAEQIERRGEGVQDGGRSIMNTSYDCGVFNGVSCGAHEPLGDSVAYVNKTGHSSGKSLRPPW